MARALTVAASALALAFAQPEQLQVNTTTLTHLAWLRASVTGLNDSSYWLGVFYPANASTAKRDPLPYPATAPWTEVMPAKYVMLPVGITSGYYGAKGVGGGCEGGGGVAQHLCCLPHLQEPACLTAQRRL